MPDWLLSGSARRLAEELEEDGVKLDEHDSVRERCCSTLSSMIFWETRSILRTSLTAAKQRNGTSAPTWLAMASPRFGCELSRIQILCYATTFDCLASISAHLWREGYVRILLDERWMNDGRLRLRFVRERSPRRCGKDRAKATCARHARMLTWGRSFRMRALDAVRWRSWSSRPAPTRSSDGPFRAVN